MKAASGCSLRKRKSLVSHSCITRAETFRWIASDKSSRISISTFQLALKLHEVEVDSDEVECMVANMIYRVSDRHESPRARPQLTALGVYEGVYIARKANGSPGQDGAVPKSAFDISVGHRSHSVSHHMLYA